uniref:Transcription factor MYB35-like n=1 Tax=Tanacetum cinerariifolium TaxID=118510 RepID=A0A6L2KSJ8_TANCI|nr:transcription factor MYB35-like [Tanacetum cinerariifolium]
MDLKSFMGQKNEDEDEDENDDAKSFKNVESSRENEVVEPDNEANTTRELEESNLRVMVYGLQVLYGSKNEDEDKDENDDAKSSENVESSHENEVVEPDNEANATRELKDKQADEVIDAYLETNIALPEEAEKPTADHAEQLEVPKNPDQKSTEHESIISSDDQGLSIAHEVEPPHDIPKTKNADEPNKQEEIMQEIFVIKGADVSSEVTGEEGKPSIQVSYDTSKMVSDDTDIKEQSSPGKSVSKNSDSLVELENVKQEMKSMETLLLGAARQAQEQQTLMSFITAHFQVINKASSSSTSSPVASIVQGNLPSYSSIWSDYLVGDQEQVCTNESDLGILSIIGENINNYNEVRVDNTKNNLDVATTFVSFVESIIPISNINQPITVVSTSDVVNNKQTVGIVNGSIKFVNGTSLVKRETTLPLVKSV